MQWSHWQGQPMRDDVPVEIETSIERTCGLASHFYWRHDKDGCDILRVRYDLDHPDAGA
ncbi:MAG: hypothetical protein LAT62_13465 [Natronospirillum sp.]|uniref:hypothetical protein n=1 Tax=Natronospirillum sp. TaxID=2812955 RepID=UPI0025FFDCB4|nr:hypothetical protein [Natronospirillum sp.]MCH8552942.1 hypothetical protein [Natronospirillum sp.]